MIPFVTAQIQAIIEDIRLLETFVTAPLGLYSDIKMLRESLPFPEAADLSRDETRERRTAFRDVTDSALALALGTVGSLNSSLDALDTLRGWPEVSGLEGEWIDRARRVLARAAQRVAGEMRENTSSKIRGLYVIVDPDAMRGRPVVEVAEATLMGGASLLQLRDKSGDKGQILALARNLKSLCNRHGALFVVNDDADVALSCDAHGLHVGQTDLPVPEARRVLAPHQIVGRSNNSVDEAMTSQAQEVDYLAVGAVFTTDTMGKSGRHAIGVETVSKIKGLVSRPVVAIGGINASNITDVVRAGADCVCVVSAVTCSDDPQAATRQLVEAFKAA